ncbi:MAG: putative glycosyltransferase [Planctomycetota bacterium]|jgi:predicted glycosyltransferase
MPTPTTSRSKSASEHRPRRILLYSHDSFGLGHLRRTLNIAERLSQRIPSTSIVIATGSPCATCFELPPNVDVVKLPAAGKDEQGNYTSRSLPGNSLAGLIRMRARILTELVRGFRPELMIVDHKVTGLEGELLPALERARRQGTRLVLGLRDIIDAPESVAKEWSKHEIQETLAERYDRILIYGSESVYDPRNHYPLPAEARAKVQFTGYVVRQGNGVTYRALPPLRPQVLVTVGGGEDGVERIESYLDAIEERTPEWFTTIVLGPLLDTNKARRIKRRARRMPSGVRVHSFYEDLPRLLADCSAVVSMAGYNTVAEILQARKPAVLLPRTTPRVEQLLRAQCLAQQGLTDYLVQPSPQTLRMAVAAAVERGRIRGLVPPLNGLDRVAEVAAEELGLPRLESEIVSA